MTKGQRIRTKREERNMGLTELAEKAHMSKQTLYKYENDIVTNIPSDKIEALANALEIAPSYLMGWDDFVKDVTSGQVSLDEMNHAIKMYELFKNSNPKIQEMVQYLLEEGNSQGANPQD